MVVQMVGMRAVGLVERLAILSVALWVVVKACYSVVTMAASMVVSKVVHLELQSVDLTVDLKVGQMVAYLAVTRVGEMVVMWAAWKE